MLSTVGFWHAIVFWRFITSTVHEEGTNASRRITLSSTRSSMKTSGKYIISPCLLRCGFKKQELGKSLSYACLKSRWSVPLYVHSFCPPYFINEQFGKFGHPQYLFILTVNDIIFIFFSLSHGDGLALTIIELDTHSFRFPNDSVFYCIHKLPKWNRMRLVWYFIQLWLGSSVRFVTRVVISQFCCYTIFTFNFKQQCFIFIIPSSLYKPVCMNLKVLISFS